TLETLRALVRAHTTTIPFENLEIILGRGTPLTAAQMLDFSLRASNAKARAELRWAPRYPSYREGLRTLARVHA
ncbi:arylamine N-acetyltransferase, partial [Nocardia sp. NPDC004582]